MFVVENVNTDSQFTFESGMFCADAMTGQNGSVSLYNILPAIRLDYLPGKQRNLSLRRGDRGAGSAVRYDNECKERTLMGGPHLSLDTSNMTDEALKMPSAQCLISDIIWST
jgi:hypothetical protein